MDASNPEPLDPKTAVSVGRIVSAHGVRGEVKVAPLTDFPERFDVGATLWLDGVPLSVNSSRWEKTQAVIKLAGVNDRTAAESLRGKELLAPSLHELEEGVFYLHDLIGLAVEDESGESLGKLADILTTTGANDVYVIRGERGELLLPAIEDVVKNIDVAGGRIVVALLPGLEFTPPPAARPRRRAKL